MASTERSTAMFNATFVHPANFYISGFSNMSHVKYFYVFLCFVYILTLIGNGLLLSIIYLVKTLHTPKFMIVFNLAFTDLCGSTALIPKVLDTFLFDRRYIVYEACLSYMFFVLFFGSVQSWTLVTMAFDRLIAICCPLRYHSIVTKTAVVSMLVFVWIFLSGTIALMVGLLNRLSFCGSLVIHSFYCDHGAVFRLACNDISLNYIVALINGVMLIFIPFMLIVVTYICISVALRRIASGEERQRALKTCSSHLILVALFFLPLLATNTTVVFFSSIHPNARMTNSTLTHAIPAMLNPIVYSLKTEEVMNAIKRLCKRNKLKIVTKN